MIVPFLFGIEKNPIHYLWIFYKYMEFALENDYPIIAEEAYFEKPSIYEAKKEYPFLNIENNYNTVHEFKKPTDDDMKKLKKYIITKEEKQKIISEYKTDMEAYKSLLVKENKKIEKLITKKIEEIEKKDGKIDAILTWTWYKSLEKVCKEKNIQLILLEQTTFRPNTYGIKLGYFQFYDKYNSYQVDADYIKFLQENNNIFTRKELLAIFLSKENLQYINYLNNQPSYEFGINIGPDHDPLAEANCNIRDTDVLKQITKISPSKDISLRVHPAHSNRNKYNDLYNVDNSKSSLEWILNCRRIVSVGSNISFETMLLGRTAYILGDNFPYLYGGINSLKYIDEKVCDIKYLNYLIFCYYVPYDLMFNNEYIKWRLTNPELNEIYNYNQNYIMKKYRLRKNIFKITAEERITEILKNVHNLSNEEILHIKSKSLDNEIRRLKQQLTIEQEKNAQILGSKSWKITKPLRWLFYILKIGEQNGKKSN